MNSSATPSTLPVVRIGLALALVVLLPACAKKAAEPAAAPAKAGEASFETDEQKVSYGIGYSMGLDMAQQADFQTDSAAMQAGIADGLAAQAPRVKQADLQSAFQAIQQRMQAAAAEAAAVQQKFLEENKARPGVVVTDSGLQYEVVSMGDGPKPKETDTVQVAYKGTLIDGTEFDSDENAEFEANRVIPGWTEALQLMPVGSKWKLYIPAELAYGPQPQRDIPANSTLVFDIELKGIK